MSRSARKYEVTNLTTGIESVYNKGEFAKMYPETFRLMDENGISKLVRDGEQNKTGYVYEEFDVDLPGCQRCGAVSIVEVNAKCSDMCEMTHLHRSYDGYVLRGMGVGEDDYVEFDFCVSCGQIQGQFPKRIHGAIITRDTENYHA